MSLMNILTVLLFTSMPVLSLACDDSKIALDSVNVITNTTSSSPGLFIANESLDKTIPNKSAIRSRIVTVETANLLKKLTTEQPNTLTLNFFDNSVFYVVQKKQIVNESGNITWIGELPSESGSIALLSVSKNTIDGSLDIPNKGLFTVRHQLNGNHLVEEIDRSAIQ